MDEIKTAQRRKKTEMVGKGCFIQAIGLLCPVVGALAGPLGIIVGLVFLVVLLIVGSTQSTKLVCSNCGTPLADKHVKECPGCHAFFA